MYRYIYFQKSSEILIHVTETCWWRAEIEQSDYFFSALLGNGNDIYSTRKPKMYSVGRYVCSGTIDFKQTRQAAAN